MCHHGTNSASRESVTPFRRFEILRIVEIDFEATPFPPSSSSASRSRYTNSFSSFPGRREAPSFTASHLPPVFLIYTESLNPKRRTFPTFNFNLSPEGGRIARGKEKWVHWERTASRCCLPAWDRLSCILYLGYFALLVLGTITCSMSHSK